VTAADHDTLPPPEPEPIAAGRAQLAVALAFRQGQSNRPGARRGRQGLRATARRNGKKGDDDMKAEQQTLDFGKLTPERLGGLVAALHLAMGIMSDWQVNAVQHLEEELHYPDAELLNPRKLTKANEKRIKETRVGATRRTKPVAKAMRELERIIFDACPAAEAHVKPALERAWKENEQ
jgi:glycine/D-amino acid oxidase-like deaminating enzyme